MTTPFILVLLCFHRRFRLCLRYIGRHTIFSADLAMTKSWEEVRKEACRLYLSGKTLSEVREHIEAKFNFKASCVYESFDSQSLIDFGQDEIISTTLLKMGHNKGFPTESVETEHLHEQRRHTRPKRERRTRKHIRRIRLGEITVVASRTDVFGCTH